MSFALDIRITGFASVEGALARLSPLDSGSLLEGLARLIQQQTRTRIEEEKTAPDGAAWPRNKTGNPTLYRDGTLSRSIDYAVSGDQVIVGSGLIYAAPHQFGATIKPKNASRLAFQIGNRIVFAMKVVLPPRPFLGVSADNAREILETVADYVRRKLG